MGLIVFINFTPINCIFAKWNRYYVKGSATYSFWPCELVQGELHSLTKRTQFDIGIELIDACGCNIHEDGGPCVSASASVERTRPTRSCGFSVGRLLNAAGRRRSLGTASQSQFL